MNSAHVNTTVASSADSRRAISNIRRRLERFELQHLRDHATELAERLERVEEQLRLTTERLNHAEQCAESWRNDYLDLMLENMEEGESIGLAKDGSLHIVKPDAGGAA